MLQWWAACYPFTDRVSFSWCGYYIIFAEPTVLCSIRFILVDNLWFHSLVQGSNCNPIWNNCVPLCLWNMFHVSCAVSVHFCNITFKLFLALLCSLALSISYVLVCCFSVSVQFTVSLYPAIVQMDPELWHWGGKVTEAFPYFWINKQELI